MELSSSVGSKLSARHRELTFALDSKDVSQALIAVDALRKELVMEQLAEDSDGMTSDEGEVTAKLEPVASLVMQPSASRCLDVADQSEFVSDVATVQKVFRLASGAAASVTVHRVGGSLVLDGTLDDKVDGDGLRDPETGEVIVLTPSKRTTRRHLALDRVVGDEDGRDWRQFLSYYQRQTTSRTVDVIEHSDVRVRPVEDDSYRRLVKWRFDEVEMLLGSDALVYASAGDKEADVCVHAQNLSQRVTEVAALDMWLENTINQADDCAICYHRDGHVQGYQLLRTQDLPIAFRHSQDDPSEVIQAVASLRDRAVSLLRFVQRNCTEDAATYCLTRRLETDEIQLWKVSSPSHGDSLRTLEGAVARLCLRIARRLHATDQIDRRKRLLDRCVALADDNFVKAEACLLLGQTTLANYDNDCHLRDFGPDSVAASTGLWLVSPPPEAINDEDDDDDMSLLGVMHTTSETSGACDHSTHTDYGCALEVVSRGLEALSSRPWRKKKRNSARRGVVRKHHRRDDDLEGDLRELADRARLGLAALYYSLRRPGAALRELASCHTTPSRLRFALVYAQMASVVTESTLEEHRKELVVEGVPSRVDRDLPVEVTADVEANLTRAVKAVVSGGLPAGADLLRVVYSLLGERYVRVERLTKAARHFSEGVELFRGLGDAPTAAWLKLRLAAVQHRLARRASTPSEEVLTILESAHLDFVHHCVQLTNAATRPNLIGASQAIVLSRRILAKAYVSSNHDDAELSALRYADSDRLRADAHYRRGLRLFRCANGLQCPEATDHLRHAIAAAHRALTHRSTLKASLDVISMRVDLANVLLVDAKSAEALSALTGALDSFDHLHHALQLAEDRATKLASVVLTSFVHRLNDVLKHSIRTSPDEFQSPLRAAYAASLRCLENVPSTAFSSRSQSSPAMTFGNHLASILRSLESEVVRAWSRDE